MLSGKQNFGKRKYVIKILILFLTSILSVFSKLNDSKSNEELLYNENILICGNVFHFNLELS